MSRIDEIRERWLEFKGRRRGRSDVRCLLDVIAMQEKMLKAAEHECAELRRALADRYADLRGLAISPPLDIDP